MVNQSTEEKARRLDDFINGKKIISIENIAETENIQENQIEEHDNKARKKVFKRHLKGSSAKNEKESEDENESIVVRRKYFIILTVVILIALITFCCILIPQLYKSVSNDIEIEKVIENAMSCIEVEKYEEGLELLGTLSENSRYASQVQEQTAVAKEKYEKNTIQKAEEMLSNKQYSDAYILVNNVAEYLGNTELLMQEDSKVISNMKEYLTPDISIEYDKDKLVEGELVNTSLIQMKLTYGGCYFEDVTPEKCDPEIIEKSGENVLLLSWNSGEQKYSWNIDAMPKVVGINAEYIGKELKRGDKVSAADIRVTGFCTDESERKITEFSMSSETVENYGINALEITCGDLVCKCEVNAKPLLSDLEVHVQGSSYATGTKLGQEDIVVTKVFENGEKERTDEYNIVEGTVKTAGSNTIKVSVDSIVGETIVQGYQNIKLKQVSIFNEEDFNGVWDTEIHFDNNIIDNLGQSHDNVMLGGNYSVFYNVDNKYSTIGGELFILDEYKTTKQNAKLEIYGDDVLLYSNSITGGDMPSKFELPIGNVQILKITFEGYNGSWTSGIYEYGGVGEFLLRQTSN